MRGETLALAITASVVLNLPQCESDQRSASSSPRGWFELRPVAAESYYFDQLEGDELYAYGDDNYYDDHYWDKVSAQVPKYECEFVKTYISLT